MIERINLKREVQPFVFAKLPFRFPDVVVSQGYFGPYSHFATRHIRENGNREGVVMDDSYCIDFVLPLGTPVLASYEADVVGGFYDCDDFYEGSDFEIGRKVNTNFLFLRNNDIHDSVCIYSHLERGSVQVSPGERVFAGQVLARTGKSGWIGGIPHLHFGVYEFPRDQRGISRLSFPVKFDGCDMSFFHKDLKDK